MFSHLLFLNHFLVVYEAIRDLHLMTRVAGWLYFGGIERSEAFTAMETASEECKVYPQETCPFYNSDRAPCPCDWDGVLFSDTCTDFNKTVSRSLQKIFWGLQSSDADPLTGKRTDSQSYFSDGVGNTPATTQWSYDPSLLPGAEKGRQASGFATSYDRLRVGSAMAIAKLPIYNYARNMGRRNHIIGVYMGMQEDGLFTGFNGCQYSHADFSFWQR